MPDQDAINTLVNSWTAVASAVAAIFSAATAGGMWYFGWRDRVRNETPVVSATFIDEAPGPENDNTNLLSSGDLGFTITNHSNVLALVSMSVVVSIVNNDVVISRVYGRGVFGGTRLSSLSPFESRPSYFRWDFHSRSDWPSFKKGLASADAQLHVRLETQAFNAVNRKRKTKAHTLFLALIKSSDGLALVANEFHNSRITKVRLFWIRCGDSIRRMVRTFTHWRRGRPL